MSTTTNDMARSPFSTAAFAQLVRRLRHTNARYNQIALQFRCRIRRTHHAKRRAHRLGLSIDTSKARACPEKYVSRHPPPVLDRSTDPGWVGTQATAYATTETEITSDGHDTAQGDAYMHGSGLRNLPEIVVRRQRRPDGRQRVILRLPPLKLQLNTDCMSNAGVSQFQGPPGAPRLLPRQLPEDECGVEEMIFESSSCSSPSTDESDSLLTPLDVQMSSGLCITVPPRGLKRKLRDVEADGNTAVSQQPKRFLKALWSESQRQ